MNIVKVRNSVSSLNHVAIVVFIVLFFVSGAVFGQEPAGISEIRSLYGTATNAVADGTYPPVSIGFGPKSSSDSTPYGVAELYGDPATPMLVMVKINQTAPDHTVYTEYLYYPNGELAFALERIILTESKRKVERRYYLHAGKLIRYLLDVDSKRTTFDVDLSKWEIQLKPLIVDSQKQSESYSNSIGPMLSSIAGESERIVLSLNGYEDVFLQVKTGSNVWKIEVEQKVYAATFPMAEGQSGSLIRDFSFTGGAGIRYVLQNVQSDGISYLNATRYEVVGGPWQRTYPVLFLPIGTGTPVVLEIPFPEGEEEPPNGEAGREVIKKAFSLPEIALSQSGTALLADETAAAAQEAIKAQASYLETKVFGYEEFYGSNGIQNQSPPYLQAFVLSEGGRDQVDVMRPIPSLTEAQGHAIVAAGYDVFRVDLDSVSNGSPWPVRKVEWLSANELLILLTRDGEERAVTAVFDGREYQDEDYIPANTGTQTRLTDDQDTELFLKDRDRFNGPAVIELQKVLMAAGYDLGADGADGWFGPATDRALRSFQTERGMEVTGRIYSGKIPDLPEWHHSVRNVGITRPADVEIRPSKLKPDTSGRITGRFGTLVLDRQYRNTPIETMNVLFPRDGELINVADATPGIIFWSPSGRRLVLLEADTYANLGDSTLVVIDLLLEQAAVISLASLLKGHNLGYRERLSVEEIVWHDDDLWFLLKVDFLGASGHPAIDDLRKDWLGKDFARNDPITIGWLVLETSQEPVDEF
jgi:peptidoglycan hydrolase-like protein with peptidoglycan-binding domain